jgi:hypothetical protein
MRERPAISIEQVRGQRCMASSASDWVMNRRLM